MFTGGACSGGGCLVRGCLVRGCLIRGEWSGLGPGPGGLVWEDLVSGGAWWRPPDGHCCGRYVSYWNAFLLLLNLQNYMVLIVALAIISPNIIITFDKVSAAYDINKIS